jgi:ribosome-binding factor A
MTDRKNAQPSQRQLRVGEQIRHIVAQTLMRGHFHDPALLDAGRVTVTEVRVSPDLRHATAYVITLGGEDMDSVLPALNEAAPVFQQAVNKETDLRNTPRIRFIPDESFANADRIEALLRSLPDSRSE